MDINQVLFFLGASVAIIVAPGPGLLYVLYNSLKRGLEPGVNAAFGCFLAVFSHILLVVLGVATFLQKSETLFTAVKWAGAFYLLYIGYKAFSSKPSAEPAKIDIDQVESRSDNVILNAFFTNTLNPKLALFFISFFPQFVPMETFNKSMLIFKLGLVFAVMTWAYFTFAGFVAFKFRSIVGDARSQRVLDQVSGSVFIFLGLKLLLF